MIFSRLARRFRRHKVESGTVGHDEGFLEEVGELVHDFGEVLEDFGDDIDGRPDDECPQPSPVPNPVTTLVISVNTERDPNTMAFQIKDDDTAKVASVTYLDAKGFKTDDPGVTVAFTSSDPAVLAIDGTSGAISPAAPGTAQIQATATNADGSTVTGTPADVEILAGAAATFAINIA